MAGRSLGPILATLTVFATWFGAESLIGSAGAAYTYGLSGGSAEPFGYGICVILTGLVFARPLWRLRLTTLADLFHLRFARSVERLAVIVMVPTSLLWAAAQIRAFGQVLSATSGLEVEVTIAIAALVVIAYTIFGGLLADVWTDFVQGIALIVGLAVLFWVVVWAEGLPLGGLRPGALDVLGAEPRPLLAVVEEWTIPIVGSMIAAELVTRILASRSAVIARNATVVAGAAYLAIGLMPVALGLVGAALLPGLAEPEQVLLHLAERFLPGMLFVIFAGALVSAILSTVDSALLAAAGLVSHNVIVPLRPALSERSKVLLARGGVAFFGALAYAMAVRAEAVYVLIEEASAFGSSGIVTVVTFGLFTRIGGTAAAIAALVAGIGSWVLGAHVLDVPYPYLTSLGSSAIAYLGVAAAGSRAGRTLAPVGAAVALVVGVAAGCARPAPADLAFRGGLVYTVDPALPRAQAVAVRDGRIVYVGDAAGLGRFLGPSTEVVDLGGRMLLPGFIDTHVHPLTGGIELGECDLNGAQARSDIERLVADCAARDPEAAWVQGGGFQLPIFPGGAPDRRLLDRLVSDRPAYLTSADGHSAWVNTRALEIAGIDARTADPPPDGVIVRNLDGSPQGTLRESAMGLVSRHIPARSDAEREAGLRRGLSMAVSLGITTLHEASADEPALRAYRSLERAGELTVRSIIALRLDPSEGPEQVEALVSLRDRYTGRLVRPVAAKIFVDGIIESGTAALLDDYVDRAGWRGELVFPEQSLMDIVEALDRAGFKFHIHAIGDRAIRVALDALEARARADEDPGPRHLLAHIELFNPRDIPRFARLGVVASFQPLWAYADTYITELTEPRLGPERSRWLYPIRSMVESGAIVAGGSDWSVTSMDPLEAIEVAVTRRDPDLGPGPSWIPEERVDVEIMLDAYSMGGAIASDLEAEIGSIAVGKIADLIVLDRNLLEIPAQEISDARVDLTVFEGRVVYRRSNSSTGATTSDASVVAQRAGSPPESAWRHKQLTGH